MARSGAGHPSKAGEQTLLPFRQNRLQGAWACLRELDSLSSSTKRVDPCATTRVHALRRGRTIPIIDTQRPAASCNTVSVTSSRSRAASLRARRDHRNLRIFAVTLRRRRHDLKKAQLPVPPQKPIRAVPALSPYAYQEASSLVLALFARMSRSTRRLDVRTPATRSLAQTFRCPSP